MSPVLTVVESTADHIYRILQEPSEITLHEIERCRMTPWVALKALNELMKTGRADTLRIDGYPSVVFGHNPVPSNKYKRANWFIASERYWALGARGVVHARNYWRRLGVLWPGVAFESYSYSDHPDLNRWFKSIGFLQSFGYDVPEGCTKFVFQVAAPSKKTQKT